ncbi:MAG: NAD(P)H-quinone oxidoreductase subunit N [Gloeomargarita sp. SKYGB_i_bin116]|nr:NAD(P)H-quinone oxidoreductase subunit N [Gloeomargarita sp. SKYGB_i_bin116]
MIPLADLNTGTIWPELIVVLTLTGVLLADLITGRQATRWTPYLAVAGLLASLVALAAQWSLPVTEGFAGSFQADRLGILFRGMIALSGAIGVLIAIRYVNEVGSALGEYITILLVATVGGMFLAGSDEMVMVFVSLETLGLASYLLAGYMKRDVRSNEAALKYLLIGATSSAIFLYGLSLLYGLSGGETRLGAIAQTLVRQDLGQSLGVLVALVFVIAGIAFKLSAVPFHQWTPDVYEGSPTPVVAFLSVGSKAAGFALAIRLLVTAFPEATPQWRFVFEALAILSMVLGNVVALTQTSLKRLLAYSSIGQAGFLMIGLAIGTPEGYASILFYTFIYLFTNLGAFACVILFSLRAGTDEINEYAGLYQKDPLLTLGLSLCLLSLGGIPPLAGFFGKLYIFWAGWQAGAYTLVLVGLVTSVISIYYYIRVVRMAVVKEPQEMSLAVQNYPAITWDRPGLPELRAVLVTCVAVTAVAGLLANPLLAVANQAVNTTPFLQSSVAQQLARR